MLKRSAVFKLMVLLSLALFVTGCATQSATHVKAFSDASSSLVLHTETVLNVVDSSTIDRKLTGFATKSPDELKTLALEDFAYVKGVYGRDANKLPVFRALKSLKKYTKALGDLSTADLRGEVDKASQELYGSLTSLSKEYKNLNDNDLGISDETFAIFSTAIDAIGVVIVEKKRSDAIKKIVTGSNDFVATLCDAISQKIDVNVDLVKINKERIVREEIEDYKSHANKFNLEDKLQILRKIQVSVVAFNNIDNLYKDAKKVPKLVKKAHQDLYNAVQEDKFTSEEIAKSIGEMNEFKTHLESFYKELLTTEDK